MRKKKKELGFDSDGSFIVRRPPISKDKDCLADIAFFPSSERFTAMYTPVPPG